MIHFLGDTHSKPYHPPKNTIHVGDMGVGFGVEPLDCYFIHGNHDNPDLCKQYPNFLGRYGYLELDGFNIFFVSGAYSIDKHLRTIGVDWWENEQLSYIEMTKMLSLYHGADIIVSHDCPSSLYPKLGIKGKTSLTANALQMLLESPQKPKQWFFGHHHVSREFYHYGVNFRCLAELEIVQVSH